MILNYKTGILKSIQIFQNARLYDVVPKRGFELFYPIEIIEYFITYGPRLYPELTTVI